ncbi:PAS domain-containing protein [Fodinicurvata sp. EGI_FJ10296]|uniref:PAS domain-containing protein n=1 Tax=Fodinicurvata sp. EGI_FJ10296 TaxID=3231908 RepID=UPI003451E876
MLVENGIYTEPTEAHAQEPRLGDLVEFWNECRGGRSMPSRADLDVIDLKPWLGNLILLEVRHDPLDYFYRVFGSLISQNTSRDLTGKWLSECIDAGAAPASSRDSYNKVLSHRAPLYQVQSQEVTPGRLWQVVRVLLPLSNENDQINHIIVGNYPLMTTIVEKELTF